MNASLALVLHDLETFAGRPNDWVAYDRFINGMAWVSGHLTTGADGFVRLDFKHKLRSVGVVLTTDIILNTTSGINHPADYGGATGEGVTFYSPEPNNGFKFFVFGDWKDIHVFDDGEQNGS